ncbi:unnamed protein product [Amoebophrya sp. A120]|nr:unnamed protein product [Amoebophrya sp. A120]|eukprot:GSA120T00017653001.1
MAKLLLENGVRAERLSLGSAQKLRGGGVDASLLLPCFVRHASLPDVRECIDAECLDINAEIHLANETVRVISTFRDCIDSVIELMGEGARCENLVIRGARALQEFSRDRQNVHTSPTNKALCRNVQAAYKLLEEFSIGVALEEWSQTLLELETELQSKNIPDSVWQQAQEANKSACSGRGLAQVRRAVIQAFNRFKMDLDATPSPSPLVTSGPQALALVYRALRAALSGRPDFNLCADVLSPIASALLQTQSEYGWNNQACGPGSVSMVLQVLEGRVEVDEAAPSVASLQAMLTDIAGWKKMLQKTINTAEYHALFAEAQARLLEFCDPAKLQEVYDRIIGGDHAIYCTNKLRGLLFQALTKEFGDDLAKLRADAEEERDNTQLCGLIQDLGDVAEVFTQVCTDYMVEVVDPVSLSPRYSTADSVAVAAH